MAQAKAEKHTKI